MKTIMQLREESGQFWPEDEPLDFRNDPAVDAYYDDDLKKVANANADWIERVRVNFPELINDVPTTNALLNRVNKLKR